MSIIYGYCPICGATSVSRERRPNGNDTCKNNHVYPSSQCIYSKPRQEALAYQSDIYYGVVVRCEEFMGWSAPDVGMGRMRFVHPKHGVFRVNKGGSKEWMRECWEDFVSFALKLEQKSSEEQEWTMRNYPTKAFEKIQQLQSQLEASEQSKRTFKILLDDAENQVSDQQQKLEASELEVKSLKEDMEGWAETSEITKELIEVMSKDLANRTQKLEASEKIAGELAEALEKIPNLKRDKYDDNEWLEAMYEARSIAKRALAAYNRHKEGQ